MAKRRITAALLAMATTIGIGMPASAQINLNDIESLISSWGLSLGAFAPNQATVRANIETRRNQLEAEINSELTAGRITASEAASLRAQLADINARISASVYSGGGLSVGEVRDILTSLRSLNNNIRIAINNTDTVIGGGGTVGTDVSTLRSSIDTLRSRVQQARNLGAIQRVDANNLNQSLNWVRSQLNQFSRNGLSMNEVSTINSYIATLTARFDSLNGVAGVPDSDIQNRIASLRAKINSNLSSGRLTRNEFNNLMSSLNWINAQHRTMLSGGLSASERSQLESYLLTIDHRADTYIANNRGGFGGGFGGGFDMNADLVSMRTQINTALANGRISWAESRRLLEDLNDVATLHTQYRASGGFLTQSETNHLRNMLSNLRNFMNNYM